jgi:hypothetical protein
MPETIAREIWAFVGAYALVGAVVAVWLNLAGLRRFDEAAVHAPLGVKLLRLPGFVVLWPLLVRRALGAGPPEDRA